MTTLDTGKGKSTAVKLADAHCKTVTYRGRATLQCRLCGRFPTSLVAHFASTHRAEFYAASGGAS